jgi:hypothetical protein
MNKNDIINLHLFSEIKIMNILEFSKYKMKKNDIFFFRWTPPYNSFLSYLSIYERWSPSSAL